MYTLGIPKSQYRRTTQVLGFEASKPIPYDAVKQDDGFYMFSFPEADELDFREIVRLLKSNGITTIGADDQLTERQIMKLADLLKDDLNEGTCGYTPDGKPRNKPAGPDLIRKAIRKEIKTLHEDKGNDLARDLIAKLREKTYRKMSDLELDSFSVDMIDHFLDNFEARAYAKRKLDSKTSRLDTLEENISPKKAAEVLFDKLAAAKLIGKQNRRRAVGVIEYMLSRMNFNESVN